MRLILQLISGISRVLQKLLMYFNNTSISLLLSIEVLPFILVLNLNDSVLRDKAFDIPRSPKYDKYQFELASMVFNCFNKRLLEVVSKIKIFVIKN